LQPDFTIGVIDAVLVQYRIQPVAEWLLTIAMIFIEK
jgi:hypothetical protein